MPVYFKAHFNIRLRLPIGELQRPFFFSSLYGYMQMHDCMKIGGKIPDCLVDSCKHSTSNGCRFEAAY